MSLDILKSEQDSTIFCNILKNCFSTIINILPLSQKKEISSLYFKTFYERLHDQSFQAENADTVKERIP